MDIFEEITRLRRAGIKGALATIVSVRGSIPSYESAKLLVREDGSLVGTVGGGCVEAEVWAAAPATRSGLPLRKTSTLSRQSFAGPGRTIFCPASPLIPSPHRAES